MRYHGVEGDRIEVIDNGLDIRQFNPGNRATYRDAKKSALPKTRL